MGIVDLLHGKHLELLLVTSQINSVNAEKRDHEF